MEICVAQTEVNPFHFTEFVLFCAILAKAILPVSGGTVPTLAEKRVVETLWSATNYWQISEIDFRNCCATGLFALVK